MARSDLLVSLVKSVAAGDRRLTRSTVEAIIAEERSKQRNVVADRLTNAMRDMGNGVNRLQLPQLERAPRGRDFIAEVQPLQRCNRSVGWRSLSSRRSSELHAASSSRSTTGPTCCGRTAWSLGTVRSS